MPKRSDATRITEADRNAFARDLVSALVLESGDEWGQIAAPFQLADVDAIFSDTGPLWHYLTRPRGGSKSTDLGGVCVVWLATLAQPGARGYLVASDKDQGALIIDAAAGLVERTPALRGSIEVQGYKLVSRKTGASVEVLAADGASAFGLRPALIVCDEFAQWGETRNARRVWSAVLSSAHKVKGCKLVILTSAGEPSHASYKVLEEARRNPDRWHVNEVPGPLPWVDPADLEAQRPLLLESEFEQLHLNIWREAEDRLVSKEDLAAAAVLDGPQPPRPSVHYVVSFDLGYVNDRTICIISHAERSSHEPGSQQHVVVDQVRKWKGSRRSPVDLTEVETWIVETARRYNNAAIHGDPHEAVGLLQRLRARGMRAEQWVFSAMSVGRLGKGLHIAFRERQISLPRDDHDLLDELSRTRLRSAAGGGVRLDHDTSGHDDCAVALGIGVQIHLEREPGSVFTRFMEQVVAESKAAESDTYETALDRAFSPAASMPIQTYENPRVVEARRAAEAALCLHCHVEPAAGNGFCLSCDPEQARERVR